MIIISNMNAVHNAANPYQKLEHKRVLCLCSAGMLRSPTAATILQQKYNYNTRAAGVHDYALVPVSTALLEWAEEIVCVEQSIKDQLLFDFTNLEKNGFLHNLKLTGLKNIITLDIPDIYARMDYELQEIILQQYKEKLIG